MRIILNSLALLVLCGCGDEVLVQESPESRMQEVYAIGVYMVKPTGELVTVYFDNTETILVDGKTWSLYIEPAMKP